VEVERHLTSEGPPVVRGRHLGLLAPFVAALTFAIGVGSGRALVHVGGPGRLVGSSFVVDVVVSAATAAVVTGFALVVLGIGSRRRRGEDEAEREEPPRSGWAGLVVLGVVLSLIAGLVVVLFTVWHPGGSRPRSVPSGVLTGTSISPRTGTSVSASSGRDLWSDADWIALGSVLGLAALAGAAWTTAGHSSRGRERAERPNELRQVVEASLEDIDREADPRRAVIKAYARMEQALAENGVPRRTAETSVEYLNRALRSEGVSAASARRLGGLFEWAKFSTHEVNQSMRADAISALRAFSDDLKVNR
jgi:Domain of unknown function (DUF4129)